jgi:plasmid stability protein
MPSLSIRKLEDETLQRLRVRAAHHQVSMEEEARRILRQAVMPPVQLGSLAQSYFGQDGVELDLPKREVYSPVNFDE